MLTRNLRRRRGNASVQWILFAAVITLIIVASVKFLGTETNERMENTSTGVGDPQELTQMFD